MVRKNLRDSGCCFGPRPTESATWRQSSWSGRLGRAALLCSLAGMLLGLQPRGAHADAALEAAPAAPDKAAHYLFYLHGHIVELQGRKARHPRYGVYEYDRVLEALGARGAVVISEVRPRGINAQRYARQLIEQIKRLLAAGVPTDHIAVVGFSRGGHIAILISQTLTIPIRYVWLAACPREPGPASAQIHGDILSLRERSDSVPSCEPLFARAAAQTRTRELLLELGEGHGAFYRPRLPWVQPVLDFIHGASTPQ